MSNQVHQDRLVRDIKDNLSTGKVAHATLETDDRVLARITDGIYRQPSSALRELIANAYDADSTNVYIQTDAPRFRTISIRDDGNGLTIESLANLIHHIGGSPKRTAEGAALGVVSTKDPALSPKGRRLIGKIGIGLFSVAQLTRKFQIISKVEGTDYRLVAEVLLKTYTEDELASTASSRKSVETGTVGIKAVRATDKKAHGTEIILMDLRPQTRDLLQSRDIWLRTESADQDAHELPTRPAYHIARLAKGRDDLVQEDEILPWTKSDPPEHRFAKLFQAVVDQVDSSVAIPKLETVLDNYLRMLWTLSLSAPIDYIDKHPFDLTGADCQHVYEISNDPKGQASRVKLDKKESIRSAQALRAPERGSRAPFSVFVDDIQLRRPLRFNNLPRTSHILTDPMVFVGKAEPNLTKIAKTESGGSLSFEAYLLWTPKVVPKDHNGLLVRINDASGTLFDDTFMKYQVSELTRLKQITAEVFVTRGLDAALNIDRESFNYAHPHYQYLVKWVHGALRQLTNVHKAVSSGRRGERAVSAQEERTKKLEATVKKKLREVARDEEVPEVRFVQDKSEIKKNRREGTLAFDPSVVFADLPEAERNGSQVVARREHFTDQVAAVARILEAYGVFENMSYERQQDLLRAIVAVFAEEVS